MFPYLDLVRVKRRSILRPVYYDDVELLDPGFTVQAIAAQSSNTNSRLRKRYGKGLPWGTVPPPLQAAGLAPPAVTLIGVPTLGALAMRLELTAAGILGAAVMRWSDDGGITWTTGVTLEPMVSLGTTGMTAIFPAASYDASNVYAGQPPVPEAILRWVTALVQQDVLDRHGPPAGGDRIGQRVEAAAALADKQIEEAANTQTGLWDLPVNEDEQSAVTTGGPRSYTEPGPYEWTYRQQDAAQRGIAGLGRGPNKLVGG